MRENIRSKLQHVLIQLNNTPGFYVLSRWYYCLGAKVFSWIIGIIIPEIKAVYVRNSFVTGDWVPWVSDIDFTVTMRGVTYAREFVLLTRLWKIHAAVKCIFPFIQHIAVFSPQELLYMLDSRDPGFSLVMGDMRRVDGARQDITNPIQKTAYSLLIHDWVRFFEGVSRWRCSDIVKIARYERFFRKFLPFSPDSSCIHDRKVFCANSKHCMSADEFARTGFYYANTVVASFHNEVVPQSVVQSRYTRCLVPENMPDVFLKKAHALAGYLKQYPEAIAGLTVDSGSLCSSYPRIWVFMRYGIDRKAWEEAVGFIWKKGLEICPDEPVYIFDEYALEVLLHTQRYWAFEYAHLLHHRSCIWGKDVIAHMVPASDDFINTTVFPSFVLKRAALRESVFTRPPEELQNNADQLFRLRALCEKNSLATTKKELMSVAALISKDDPYHSIEAMLKLKKISRKRLYETWSAYADGITQRMAQCGTTPGLTKSTFIDRTEMYA